MQSIIHAGIAFANSAIPPPVRPKRFIRPRIFTKSLPKNPAITQPKYSAPSKEKEGPISEKIEIENKKQEKNEIKEEKEEKEETKEKKEKKNIIYDTWSSVHVQTMLRQALKASGVERDPWEGVILGILAEIAEQIPQAINVLEEGSIHIRGKEAEEMNKPEKKEDEEAEKKKDKDKKGKEDDSDERSNEEIVGRNDDKKEEKMIEKNTEKPTSTKVIPLYVIEVAIDSIGQPNESKFNVGVFNGDVLLQVQYETSNDLINDDKFFKTGGTIRLHGPEPTVAKIERILELMIHVIGNLNLEIGLLSDHHVKRLEPPPEEPPPVPEKDVNISKELIDAFEVVAEHENISDPTESPRTSSSASPPATMREKFLNKEKKRGTITIDKWFKNFSSVVTGTVKVPASMRRSTFTIMNPPLSHSSPIAEVGASDSNTPLVIQRANSDLSPLSPRSLLRKADMIPQPNEKRKEDDKKLEKEREEVELDRRRNIRFTRMIRKMQEAVLSSSPGVTYPPPHLLLRLKEEEEQWSNNFRPSFESHRRSFTHQDAKEIAGYFFSAYGTVTDTPSIQTPGIFSPDPESITSFFDPPKSNWQSSIRANKLSIDSRVGLNHLNTGDDYLQNVFRHQSITFVYSSFSSTNVALPCEGPQVKTIDYYRFHPERSPRADQMLGDKIKYWSDTANFPCEGGTQSGKAACNSTMLRHTMSYTHANGRITIVADEVGKTDSFPDAALDDKGNHPIVMWSECKFCLNQEIISRTQPIHMSPSTYRYSFGKYLELLVYNPEFLPENLCKHVYIEPIFNKAQPDRKEARQAIIRYFRYRDVVVQFEYEHISLFEMRVPRLQISSESHDIDEDETAGVGEAEELDQEVANEEWTMEAEETKQEIVKFYEGLKGHFIVLERYVGAESRLQVAEGDIEATGTLELTPAEEKDESVKPPTSIGLDAFSSSEPAKLKDPATMLKELKIALLSDKESLLDMIKEFRGEQLNNVRKTFVEYIYYAKMAVSGFQTASCPELITIEPQWREPEYAMNKKLHLFPDSSVILREDEPSSIIACALSSQEYRKELNKSQMSNSSSATPSSETTSLFSSLIGLGRSALGTPALGTPALNTPALSTPTSESSSLQVRVPMASSLASSLSPINIATGSPSFIGQETDANYSRQPIPGTEGEDVMDDYKTDIKRYEVKEGIIDAIEETVKATKRGFSASITSTLRRTRTTDIFEENKQTPMLKKFHTADDVEESAKEAELEKEPLTEVPKEIEDSQIDTQQSDEPAISIQRPQLATTSTSSPFSDVLGYLNVYGKDNSQSPHIKCRFTHGQKRFDCTVFYAEQFGRLRRQYGFDQLYVSSLSRCSVWNADGGKSKSVFFKTLDNRLVVKQMVSSWRIAEKDALLRFAPKYFDYMEKSTESPSVLAKIFGFYTIKVKNLHTKQIIMEIDILVMEHLFYNQTITGKFDLKGIQDRQVQTQDKDKDKEKETEKEKDKEKEKEIENDKDGDGKDKIISKVEDKTLWDGDWMEGRYNSLLMIHSHSKRTIHDSLYNDTNFLADANIMDYSLLVGVDDERKELIVGIVDFIGAFTWYKKIESKSKSTYQRHKEVTVLPPDKYKTRFRTAMDHYFLAIPDKWTKPQEETSSQSNISAVFKNALAADQPKIRLPSAL